MNDIDNPDSFVKVHYILLFPEWDLEEVKRIYGLLAAIESTDKTINIYCDEDHIEWNSAKRSWVDTDYTYEDGDGNEQHVVYSLHNPDQGAKPGAQGTGTSYTTLGTLLLRYELHLYGDPTTVRETHADY